MKFLNRLVSSVRANSPDKNDTHTRGNNMSQTKEKLQREASRELAALLKDFTRPKP